MLESVAGLLLGLGLQVEDVLPELLIRVMFNKTLGRRVSQPRGRQRLQ